MSSNLHTPWADTTTVYTAESMNPPLAELDAMLTALFAGGRVTVKDKDLATPPVGPADLDTYIVATSGTGAWSGKDGQITVYDDGETGWKFVVPIEGTVAYVQDEDTEYQYSGSAWALSRPYIVAGFYAGVLEDSALCLRHTFVMAANFPAGLTGSYSKAGTAATAETIFDIKKNGSSVGSITFAISGSTGTLAMASATSFAAGDVLTIVGPSTADATLADVDFSLKGSR